MSSLELYAQCLLNTNPRRGRAEIRSYWSGRSPDLRVLSHSLTTDRIEVAGDLVVEEGRWANTTQRDELARTSSGKYLVV